VTGNAPAPATGSGDALSYFPMAMGDMWSFDQAQMTSSGTSNGFAGVLVSGPALFKGNNVTAFVLSSTIAGDATFSEYFSSSPGGVTFYGSSDATDTITAQVTPYAQLLYPVRAGTESSVVAKNLPIGKNSSGDELTMNVDQTVVVAAFETVSVGAGTFQNSAKTVETKIGTVTDTVTGQSLPYSSTETTWLAPGVGIVRDDVSVSIGGTTSTETLDLRGYTVAGVTRGLGLPFRVADNLAPADNSLWNPGAPTLTTDGQNFLAASGSSAGAVGKLFNSLGSTLATVSLAGFNSPVASFDGTNYWVASFAAGGASVNGQLVQRVSTTGVVLDATPILLSPMDPATGIAFGSSNGLCVMTHFNVATSLDDIYGILLNPNGTISGSGPFPITSDASSHFNAVVGFDGTNYLVVWEQTPTPALTLPHIYGIRVSPAGTLIDPAPFPISTAANGQTGPSIAFDGTNYLVVWLDLRNQNLSNGSTVLPDVYGTRISKNGILLDGAADMGGIPIQTASSSPRGSVSVAFTGTEYLVTWSQLGFTGTERVQATRVLTNGTFSGGINTAITVSEVPSLVTDSQFAYPAIAAGSSSAAIVWLDNPEVAGLQKGLEGVSVFPF